MKKYIALLRGINVGGRRKIPMAGLRQALSRRGFKGVSTYIQSGNVVFDAEGWSAAEAGVAIASIIREEFGHDVRTLVLEPVALEIALEDNPYINDPRREHKSIYFVFLYDVPDARLIEQLHSYDYTPEEFTYRQGCIHFYAALGMGKARMDNNFFEQKLKVDATTRNLNTVLKLLAMAGMERE